MKAPTKVRLYINGKRQKDIYPEHKAFYVWRYNALKKLKSLFIFALIIGFIVFNIATYNASERLCGLNAVECMVE